jgi:hypothetical protein
VRWKSTDVLENISAPSWGSNNKRSRKPEWKRCIPPECALISCLAYRYTLKIEGTRSIEISVDLEQTTRRYNPVDRTFHNHRCENLMSCTLDYGPLWPKRAKCGLSDGSDRTVPHLRLVITSFPPRRPGLEPGSGCVGFVMDKAALEQVFSEYSSFPMPITHPTGCSTVVIYHPGLVQ